jgi:hypothetical protein
VRALCKAAWLYQYKLQLLFDEASVYVKKTHEMKQVEKFYSLPLAPGGRIKIENRRLFLQIMRSEYLAIFIGRFFGSTDERKNIFLRIST